MFLTPTSIRFLVMKQKIVAMTIITKMFRASFFHLSPSSKSGVEHSLSRQRACACSTSSLSIKHVQRKFTPTHYCVQPITISSSTSQSSRSPADKTAAVAGGIDPMHSSYHRHRSSFRYYHSEFSHTWLQAWSAHCRRRCG